MTPLISAVWSCAPELAGRYPARYLFEFLDNHGMLSVTGSPRWRTVVGGSARYVEQAAKQLTRGATPARRSAASAGPPTGYGSRRADEPTRTSTPR